MQLIWFVFIKIIFLMIKTPFCFLCVLVLLFIGYGCQKEALSQLGIYEEIDFRSERLAEDFQIFTFLPPNYSEQRNYPIVYLMDAEWYFEKTVRDLEVSMASGKLPECILVGVGYQNFDESKRFRDYTFPADEEYDILTGQADRYHEFLEKDLLPFMEAQYRVDTTQRILMGHSLGGLNTIYSLFQQRGTAFSGFVALSPSLWWADQYIFGLEETLRQPNMETSREVYIGVGTDEPPSMTILAEEMAERLQQPDYLNWQVRLHLYKGASHGQTPDKGFLDGLAFILN
jgi:predicted alpha/beta superfamily hydrolase